MQGCIRTRVDLPASWPLSLPWRPIHLAPHALPCRPQVLDQSPAQRGGPKELAPVQRLLQKVPLLHGLELPALVEVGRLAHALPTL